VQTHHYTICRRRRSLVFQEEVVLLALLSMALLVGRKLPSMGQIQHAATIGEQAAEEDEPPRLICASV